MEKINKSVLSTVIKVRNTESYKGNYGRVLIIAGSLPFGGAAILSASAAIHTGAGLVTVATIPEKFTALNVEIPEAMTIDYNKSQELIAAIIQNNVIVLGPGLGTSDSTDKIIQLIIKYCDENTTIIMDASALSVVAENNIDLTSINNLILTPHQGEWQRLSNLSIPEQTKENNLKAINKLAPNATLIVKKHLSEIYYQNKVSQIQAGNAGMATGGMGDTLTGVLAGFIGQFGNSLVTVQTGLFLHSYIADQIYKSNYVVLPSTLISKIPKYMKKFTSNK
ncbi:NAD(P)H-hydrate dehydratase [Companilactobacillus allii]|uniref:ADP-dependent (S)-NAD(P)H-hydrate dehydratase n=1 Tax=Companilactobacillus allii TaxID=1847728 RepID=A0A1P8Q3J3_9LACO|nr:NAD(P)H-hydrate dehydratase [Companilactobacillus allii]APX72432.1 NAD(P)H-hydrate dehydratase [Companilactobacillus allii]USQ69527.1 NAD(P)H-hydrate dehydratase [Companilactobacillus allii]